VVVFEKGDICICNFDLQIVSEARNRTSESPSNCIWAYITAAQKSCFVATIREINSAYYFEIYSISSNTNEITFTTSHELKEMKQGIASCSFDLSKLTLSVLNSDERLYIYTLPSRDHLYLQDSLSVVFQRQLDCFDLISGSIRSTYVDSGKLILIGNAKAKENQPKQSILFLLWDTNNGMVQENYVLENDKPGVMVNSVWSAKAAANLLVSLTDRVIVCSLSSNPATLAQVVRHGSFNLTKTFLSPSDQLVKGPQFHKLNFMEVIRSVRGGVVSESEWESALIEANHFEKHWIEKLSDHELATDREQLSSVFQEFNNYIKEHDEVSVRYIGKEVGERCLSSSFWEPLKELVSAKAITYQSLPHLIQTCMDNNQMELLLRAVLNLDDIPPKEILNMVSYFISKVRRDSLDKIMETFLQTKKDINPLHFILNMLISYPLNHFLTLPWIVRLSQKEVLILLEYLTNSITLLSNPKEMHSQWNPPPSHMITWCNLIMDSHLSMLILVDECNEAFIKLNNAIQNHLAVLDSMAMMQGFVNHLAQQKPLPSPHTQPGRLWSYSIEHLSWEDNNQISMTSEEASPKEKKTKQPQNKKRISRRIGARLKRVPNPKQSKRAKRKRANSTKTTPNL